MPDAILIAEDDSLLMPLLLATFRTSGLRVLTASTGTQALERAQAEMPTLVLLDVGLPEMNGYEVCRLIKTDKRTASIQVVMLTARVGPSDQQQAAEAGADAYLTKPFSPAELLAAVQSLMRLDRAT